MTSIQNNKHSFNTIGLMSGTSLDGLDIAHCRFNLVNQQWSYKINHAETIAYTKEIKGKLRDGFSLNQLELKELDFWFGTFQAESVNGFIQKYSIEHLDAICSHGHTIFHDPSKGLTLQIGNGAVMSNLTQLPVINDFRTQDVQLGGQGAPLVPIGDEMLFHEYDACLNLGGYANISSKIGDDRIAFDICPVNVVLNVFCTQLGLPYDDQGKIAKSGKSIPELLKLLNSISFYNENYPKSLGTEWLIAHINPILKAFDQHPIPDLLHTCIEHFSQQISATLQKLNINTCLVTGGGTLNTFLIDKIKSTSQTKLVKGNSELIEYKEALIFAFLGVLKLKGQTNVLSSVTGAKEDHCSGRIYLPNSAR